METHADKSITLTRDEQQTLIENLSMTIGDLMILTIVAKAVSKTLRDEQWKRTPPDVQETVAFLADRIDETLSLSKALAQHQQNLATVEAAAKTARH